MIQLPHRSVDSTGNMMSLSEWLAEKSKRQTTRIITELKGNKIKTFSEAMEISPVLAFEKEDKIRNFISLVRKREIRRKNKAGCQILHLEIQSNIGYKALVYRNIVY